MNDQWMFSLPSWELFRVVFVIGLGWQAARICGLMIAISITKLTGTEVK